MPKVIPKIVEEIAFDNVPEVKPKKTRGLGSKRNNTRFSKFIPLIADALIKGNSRSSIIKVVKKEGYDGSESHIDYLISAAKEVVKAITVKDQEYILARAVARHDRLYSLAVKKGDYKTALAIERSVLELYGHIGVVRLKEKQQEIEVVID